MSIFGSLFGRKFQKPPKEQWDGIIDNIHDGLAAIRPEFFSACIRTAKTLETAKMSATGAKMFPDLVVRNETMNQDIELAITVCQLHFGSLLIAAKEYVDGPEFVRMMYSDAAKYGGIIKRNEYIRRYFRDDGEEGFNKLAFCDDLAKHITGQECIILAMELEPLDVGWLLRQLSFLAVAQAFGDIATLKEAEASFTNRAKPGRS